MDADDGDPDDWAELSEAGKRVRELDVLLRCPVCKDVLRTPLRLPSCTHLCCSECMHAWLAASTAKGNKTCCPECRAGVDPADMRVDSQLHAIAAAFKAARPGMLAAMRGGTPTTLRDVRSPPRRTGRTRSGAAPTPGKDPVEVLDDDASASDGDSDFDAEPQPERRAPRKCAATTGVAARAPAAALPEYALCPICNKRVPFHEAEHHANRCLDAGAPKAAAAPSRQAPSGPPHRTLPKLHVYMMSASALKSLLLEWRLKPEPNDLSKDKMTARWNAFCVQAKACEDAARACGQHPDYAAAAKRTLKMEKNVSGAAHFPLFRDASRAAFGSASSKGVGGAPSGTAAEDTFAALVSQIKARGQHVQRPPAAESGELAGGSPVPVDGEDGVGVRPKRKRASLTPQ